MVKKLMLPQEIETFYVIPTVRKHFAMLMKEKGMKQMQIAKILGIRDAAVSQYLSEKRGNKVKFDKEIIDEIKKAVPRLKNPQSMIRETQKILYLIKETKALCRLHAKHSDVPCNCDPTAMGCLRNS